MAQYDNGARPTGCILSEGNKDRSRDNILILSGSGIVAPNTVLALDAASGKYKPAAAGDEAVAIALYGADATAEDVAVAGLMRDAEVNLHTLVFDPSVADAAARKTKFDQLRAVGIIAR